jgi:hypothetical protein
MDDLLTIKLAGCLRLLIAGGIFFVWIPRMILPQEYLRNRLDRLMFNCLHMCALATLVFPLFIAMRCFGLPFLLLFFVVTRMLFIKYWYRQPLRPYLREKYNAFIVGILRVLDDQDACLKRLKTRLSEWIRRCGRLLVSPGRWWAQAGTALLVSYALFIRLAIAFSTMAPSVSDMYQYYYWNQILMLNRLIDRVCGAPYPWGSPILLRSVNAFAHLNTVVLYNCFPVLMIGFSFFALFYFCRKILEPETGRSPAFMLALVLFAVVIPSPLAQDFFGTVFRPLFPVISRISGLAFYTGSPGLRDEILTVYPKIFFLRYSNVLPYEMADGFALLLIYFLHQALTTRRGVMLLLFAETLGIISALHPGVLIVLFPACLLLTIRTVASYGLDGRTFLRGCAAISGGMLAGNIWLFQLAVYGLPPDVGAAAPILDKIFRTHRGAADAVLAAARPELQIVAPTPLQGLLALGTLVLLGLSFRSRDREQGVKRSIIPLFTLGTLLLYFMPNLGLPRLVDQSRLQTTLALSYGLTAAQCYLQFLEMGVLARTLGPRASGVSRLVVAVVVAAAVMMSPRYVDDAAYRRFATSLELLDLSYYVYQIEDTFQPFSYTVVSYPEGFPLLISSAYHMNTLDLLTTISPIKRQIDIPSELIFLFVENAPVSNPGAGEYWYRWRPDIMLKLKEWIVMYGAYHKNLRLWKQSKYLQVYMIDNRKASADDALIWRRLGDPER